MRKLLSQAEPSAEVLCVLLSAARGTFGNCCELSYFDSPSVTWSLLFKDFAEVPICLFKRGLAPRLPNWHERVFSRQQQRKTILKQTQLDQVAPRSGNRGRHYQTLWRRELLAKNFLKYMIPHRSASKLNYILIGRQDFKRRPNTEIRALADLLGVPTDDVWRRLKPWGCFQSVPIADDPISLPHSERDTVLGILAFSPLCSFLPKIKGESPVELSPGQLLFLDGDKSSTWKGDEIGFGLFMWARKSTFTLETKSVTGRG